MIIDVVKYLLVGAKQDLDHFFEIAQEHGFMEFLSVGGKKPVEVPVTVQSLLSAIKVLRKETVKEPYLGGGDLAFAMQISERVLELKDDIEKLSEEKRVLEAEISRVAPLGDFSMDDIEYIEKEGKCKIQFFCKKASSKQEDFIYIGTEYDLDYYVAINKEKMAYPGMIEMIVDAPKGVLESRLSFVDDAIHRFEGELKEYAGHSDFLHNILIEELNKHHLSCAKKEVVYPLQNSLFVVEAWVPKNRVQTLFGLLDSMAIEAQQIAIEKDDRVPTCFENSETGMIGEDLVKIYDIPATSDKDPSKWVLIFFALFFAIIVSDGGYGALFLAIALYLKYKFPRLHGMGKRMLKLLFLLSTTTILWGVFTASYFGLSVEFNSPLAKLSPLRYLTLKKADYHVAVKDDVYRSWIKQFPALAEAGDGKTFLQEGVVVKKGGKTPVIFEEFSTNILLEFTLMIGIVHLTFAFLRYLKRNIAGLGWIAFMIGGYLWAPSVLHATSMANFLGWIRPEKATAIGLQLVYGGIGFALLASLIQNGKRGLGEISNLVQIFADVLSYLRLYALGLAGSIMAATFNQEGAALALVPGTIVILLGHLVNITIGFMGGVIHGLRLNFLEWYHYCFEGGGRLFKPLRKHKRS